ncbi:hypothetical protein LTR53_014308 [Teratosphaeriaceae sp. CCFEE 6253]|nr:hypothetical protein LTR53_014308 [Teratosphaeriaceae sp. CCFEE 6253]
MRVHLFAEPSFYAPHSPDPYDLENVGSWMTRSGIRSDLPDSKSPEMDGWKYDCALLPSQGGLDGFDRVNTLYVRMTGYPMRLAGLRSDAVCARAIQTVVDNSVLPEAIEMVTSARVFKRSTLTTLDYLLSKLGAVKTVVLLGDADRATAGLTWLGFKLQPLEPESDFMQDVVALTSKPDCKVVTDVEIIVCLCWLCFAPWEPGHWSPGNLEGDCPEKEELEEETILGTAD